MPRLSRQILMVHSQGLHARPAALFVQLARRFQSEVLLQRGRRRADGKSIMELLALGVESGSELKLTADGPDAQEAVERLAYFLTRPLVEPTPGGPDSSASASGALPAPERG